MLLLVVILHQLSRALAKQFFYQALKAYPEIETIFADFHLHLFPNFVEKEKIEMIVVFMYSQTSVLKYVDETRMDINFSQNQNIETIPPTLNALFLHTRLAHSTNRDRKNLWGGGHWAKNLFCIF